MNALFHALLIIYILLILTIHAKIVIIHAKDVMAQIIIIALFVIVIHFCINLNAYYNALMVIMLKLQQGLVSNVMPHVKNVMDKLLVTAYFAQS
jgi:hypothetical protein